MRKWVVPSVCFIAFLFFAGCGVSDRTLKNAEDRLNKLSEKGVPDSSLSRAKVFMYQAINAKDNGNIGESRKAADSMMFYIAKGEDQYDADMKRLTPWVQTERQNLAKETAELTGLHKKHADSTLAIIDSFIQMNWLLQAEANIRKFKDYIPQLQFDEKRAEELRPRVLGTWTCTNISKHRNDATVNAVEKKIFNFQKNGNVKLIEKKKGKSTPYFKEDWEFVSWGKYDIKGDTIFLMIDRFKSARQDFWDYKTKDGKKQWIKTAHPTYDSTITDGSQDRFINFQDLEGDFKRG